MYNFGGEKRLLNMPIILKAAGDITNFFQKCASNHMNGFLKVSESS
jgi:hypothetical protein